MGLQEAETKRQQGKYRKERKSDKEEDAKDKVKPQKE